MRGKVKKKVIRLTLKPTYIMSWLWHLGEINLSEPPLYDNGNNMSLTSFLSKAREIIYAKA